MGKTEPAKNAEGYIHIRCAKNGYYVETSDNGIMPPHVFESFSSLMSWLKSNLKGADS